MSQFMQLVRRGLNYGLARFNPVSKAQTITHCYRMIIGRSPTHAELIFWQNEIRTHAISLDRLITTFEATDEAKRHRQLLDQQLTTDQERYIHRLVRDGLAIYVSTDDQAVGLALNRDSRYEAHVSRLLTHILSPGDVFVDIGANIGYFSLVAARLVGPSGRVLAIEPNKRNAALLWLSSIDNHYEQIELFPVAASDTVGAIVLQVVGSNGRIVPGDELALAGMTLTPDRQPLPAHHYRAATVVLDDFLHEIARIDVVKLDVEGAEPLAIAGMQQLIKRHQPLVISEFAPMGIMQTTQRRPECYLQQLRTLGYTLYGITDTTLHPLPDDYVVLEKQWFCDGNDHIDLLGVPTAAKYHDLVSRLQSQG